jgi:hypothetical protein
MLISVLFYIYILSHRIIKIILYHEVNCGFSYPFDLRRTCSTHSYLQYKMEASCKFLTQSALNIQKVAPLNIQKAPG